MDQSKKALFKRVKERSVQDAFEKVQQWRNYFEFGYVDEAGQTHKVSLQQAAELVGIPKKTLEDYHQLLKKAERILPFQELEDKKMGHLRSMVKDWNLKQQQSMEMEEYTDELEEDIPQQVQNHAVPMDEWENMIVFEHNSPTNMYNYSEPTSPSQYRFNVFPLLNTQTYNKTKLEDDWEHQSINSDVETDDDDSI